MYIEHRLGLSGRPSYDIHPNPGRSTSEIDFGQINSTLSQRTSKVENFEFVRVSWTTSTKISIQESAGGSDRQSEDRDFCKPTYTTALSCEVE
jgi:hypothetical protein